MKTHRHTAFSCTKGWGSNWTDVDLCTDKGNILLFENFLDHKLNLVVPSEYNCGKLWTVLHVQSVYSAHSVHLVVASHPGSLMPGYKANLLYTQPIVSYMHIWLIISWGRPFPADFSSISLLTTHFKQAMSAGHSLPLAQFLQFVHSLPPLDGNKWC